MARAAAAGMLYRRLQGGARPSLVLRAGRFTARSKSKEISGAMPSEALGAIKVAGLEGRQPFAWRARGGRLAPNPIKCIIWLGFTGGTSGT